MTILTLSIGNSEQLTLDSWQDCLLIALLVSFRVLVYFVMFFFCIPHRVLQE